MGKYGLFKQSIEQAVARFREIDKKENIRIISHLDADGISACAILIKALNLENRRYSISIVTQLNEIIVNGLKKEKYNVYFFLIFFF